MQNKSNASVFLKGIIKENPVFVLILGTCPSLAMTKDVVSALGMGLAALVVLFFSNVFISVLRKIIPDNVRIPCYIVIIAATPNPTIGNMNFAVGPTNQPVFPLRLFLSASTSVVGFSERLTPAFTPKLNCAAAGIVAKRQIAANNPKSFFITDNIS